MGKTEFEKYILKMYQEECERRNKRAQERWVQRRKIASYPKRMRGEE